jgi:hypothetical protein
MCRLKLKLGDRWITKTDVGSPSEQPDVGDRLKAAFSDALKRAAVKFGIGRYLYRLPAQWVNYDPVKKQIAEIPQLPAFAIPKSAKPTKAPAPVSEPSKAQEKEPASGFVVVKAESRTPEAQKVEPTKPEAQKMPANGQELHRRLREYDAKLASQKLCAVGALLAHVTQAGVKAGYTANMNEWTGPAIPLAVDAVKEFEHNVRHAKAEPRTAA